MSLKKFIEQQNVMAAWFKQPVYDVNNLSAEDKAKLAQSIASALSPEALTCDGEVRGAKLQAKQRMLNAAVRDLEALGQTVPQY